MTISIGQKIQLTIVCFIISILWFFDSIFSNLKRIPVALGRTFLYLILVTTFLRGFYLESTAKMFVNVPQVLNPSSSQVLGSASLKIDYPILINEIKVPDISSKAVLIKDVINKKGLLSINTESKLAPASTTKLMTALVALDLYETDEILTVPSFCTEIEGQKNGFYSGDSYRVSELLKSLLINSSADAACTLSLGKVPYTEFIDLMNMKAKNLGLKDTSFTNPVGLDGINGDHVSTAEDLYLLALESRKNSDIKEAIATKETRIISESGTETYIYNTNDLLWTIPGSVGIKTGKTVAAGEVLIYEYNKDSKNIIIVVMGSQDRFGDTAKLLRWTLDSYSWQDY